MTGERRPFPHVAMIATLGAIGALVTGARSVQWLVAGSGNFGLRSFEVCSRYGCDRKRLAEMPPELFAPYTIELGLVTAIASWIAVAVLAATAALSVPRTRSPVALALARLGSLVLCIALGTGVAFVLRKADVEGAFRIGSGFLWFGIGVVAGLTAAQMLGKLHRRGDPG